MRCDATGTWHLPVRDAQFKVTARFGYHKAQTPYFTILKSNNLLSPATTEGVFHSGVDFKTGRYAPVFGVMAGQVITVAYNDIIGRHVIVQLAAFPTQGEAAPIQVVYGHLQDIFVAAGQSITCGQVLGLSGSTGKSVVGAHLHFEVRQAGRAVDPLPLLRAAAMAELPNLVARAP
jgi:murein DD-endopeptidase MepM/ murein hydrolase activator NlpD